MKTSILVPVLASLLLAVTASALSEQLPAEASSVVESYVANYCQYTSDMKLEEHVVEEIKISKAAGYVDEVKEIQVSVGLVYGNNDATVGLKQTLKLDNKSGPYQISSSTGPCETVIKHN